MVTNSDMQYCTIIMPFFWASYHRCKWFKYCDTCMHVMSDECQWIQSAWSFCAPHSSLPPVIDHLKCANKKGEGLRDLLACILSDRPRVNTGSGSRPLVVHVPHRSTHDILNVEQYAALQMLHPVSNHWMSVARMDLNILRQVCFVSLSCVFVCFQEASRNADELLQAEEEEKKKAEKRRMKNKKVNLKCIAVPNVFWLGMDNIENFPMANIAKATARSITIIAGMKLSRMKPQNSQNSLPIQDCSTIIITKNGTRLPEMCSR